MIYLFIEIYICNIVILFIPKILLSNKILFSLHKRNFILTYKTLNIGLENAVPVFFKFFCILLFFSFFIALFFRSFLVYFLFLSILLFITQFSMVLAALKLDWIQRRNSSFKLCYNKKKRRIYLNFW